MSRQSHNYNPPVPYWLSVADPDRDPVFFYPLDPEFGFGTNFFRIPDLGSGTFFDEIFVQSLKNTYSVYY
jgi:hypothetical protein